MKKLERKTDGPCCKLEAEIWSPTSQFGSWETLNYSFEGKENHEIFYQISRYIITQNDLQQNVKQENSVQFPQEEFSRYKTFDNFSRYNSHSHFFIKTKFLKFYSGIMADIGALANVWKSLLNFVMSVRMEHLGHRAYCHEIWYLRTFRKPT